MRSLDLSGNEELSDGILKVSVAQCIASCVFLLNVLYALCVICHPAYLKERVAWTVFCLLFLCCGDGRAKKVVFCVVAQSTNSTLRSGNVYYYCRCVEVRTKPSDFCFVFLFFVLKMKCTVSTCSQVHTLARWPLAVMICFCFFLTFFFLFFSVWVFSVFSVFFCFFIPTADGTVVVPGRKKDKFCKFVFCCFGSIDSSVSVCKQTRVGVILLFCF